MTDHEYRALRASLDERCWCDDVLPDDKLADLVSDIAGTVEILNEHLDLRRDSWDDTLVKLAALDHAVSALVRTRHILDCRKAAVADAAVTWRDHLRDVGRLRDEIERRRRVAQPIHHQQRRTA